MDIQVNGKILKFDNKAMTIADLLDAYDIQEKIAAVERNKEIVKKTDYEQTILADGDAIEIVHFVGGG
ncbi:MULTISPECIES: sulfur carrier protein ThiS [Clostridia]|uniref:sulfur carrier protein ThiS n=1 Tax=Clostridia TaxID=186801 RepID=UPI000EA008DD|nr:MULTISPECIES: sulfur carrier protein ThiS [Clostridia]NBJ68184.1 sulfur carrier protein ThiS [Roseburia sp. 1XD42-34]RKI81957.1 sulfur carrier protein ThiS [Clostridium sp. 1xD42-85]